MKKKNDNLYRYSVESTWGFIAVVILYVVGAASFPTRIFSFIPGAERDVDLISTTVSRTICSIVPVWLMFEIKVGRLLLPEFGGKLSLLLLPYFLVALNNIPFYSFIVKDARLSNDVSAGTVFWYILACLGGVVLEESVFRGIVFPTLLRKFRGEKNDVFLAALISSALFGLTHVVNLLGGTSLGAVAMQVGYSFLVGGMCAVALYLSGSLFYSVGLHFIFNLGGLLSGYGMIEGTIWAAPTIVLTAVFAVFAIMYTLIILFKAKKRDFVYKKIDYAE